MDQQDYMTDFFGPVIHAYTRQNAIDDGVLIDVTETAIEAGIKFPFAITQAVWSKYVEWTQDDTAKQSYQDQPGRLWDIVWMARHGMLNAKGETTELLFELDCIPRDGHSKQAECTTLKIILGPGDSGEAVLTILFPNED
jgi:hypothetical protein